MNCFRTRTRVSKWKLKTSKRSWKQLSLSFNHLKIVPIRQRRIRSSHPLNTKTRSNCFNTSFSTRSRTIALWERTLLVGPNSFRSFFPSARVTSMRSWIVSNHTSRVKFKRTSCVKSFLINQRSIQNCVPSKKSSSMRWRQKTSKRLTSFSRSGTARRSLLSLSWKKRSSWRMTESKTSRRTRRNTWVTVRRQNHTLGSWKRFKRRWRHWLLIRI